MTRIVFRSVAQREYDEAARWYDQQRPGLGRQFEAAVDETLSRIVAHPDSFAEVEAHVYEVRVARFPFCIYYRLRGGAIVVLAVFHHARDPETRKRRK